MAPNKAPSVPPDRSVQSLLQRTTPGFGFLQRFFSTWFNLDLTTLAVILTVFGAISQGTQQLKGVALHVYRWITRFFTASVSIPGNDRLNREVLNWLGAQVLTRQDTRILTARSAAAENDAWDFRRIKRNDYHHEKRMPIQYLPTFGITFFIHERRVFLVRRIADLRQPVPLGPGLGLGIGFSTTSPDQYVVPPNGTEPLVVMCLGRSVHPIKRFLNTCREFAEKQRESFITVRATRCQFHRESWDTTILRPIRPLHTVHMDKKIKDDLVNDIEGYLKPATRRFYTERGIPYRRGYLLYGPPGTGKTSLSLALAGRFGLELYILHTPSVSSDGELERLFTALPPQCIILLEDIDTVGIKRQSQDEDELAETERKLREGTRSGHCTLSGLLNVLDGVTSQEGRIVLMTSNAAANLDEALVRPGRIDIMIYMGHIDSDAAEDMFLRMYEPDKNEEPNPAETCAQLEPELLHKLAKDFGARLNPGVFTPAQLQGFLLNHRAQPEAALAGLESWMLAEKLKMESLEARLAEEARIAAKKRTERRELKAEQQLFDLAAYSETIKSRRPGAMSARSTGGANVGTAGEAAVGANSDTELATDPMPGTAANHSTGNETRTNTDATRPTQHP